VGPGFLLLDRDKADAASAAGLLIADYLPQSGSVSIDDDDIDGMFWNPSINKHIM
jgi:hypothetical protein